PPLLPHPPSAHPRAPPPAERQPERKKERTQKEKKAGMASIYQHRALGAGPHAEGGHGQVYSARGLSDTLDRVKAEFDVLASELTISRDQRERYEATIASQTDELEKIRGALRALEAQHAQVRQQYEYELRALRAEARQPPPPPPPPPHSQSHTHTPSQAHAQPQSQLATLSSPSVFMSDSPVLDAHHRGERDLQRARFLEQGPGLGGGGGAVGAGADGRDGRSTKRIKLDMPDSNSGGIRLPLIGPASPALTRRPSPPAPPPSLAPIASISAPQATPYMSETKAAALNEFLGVDVGATPREWKTEGSDWFAVYNPKAPRSRGLGVALVHSFAHETVVCCVHFSPDGARLATGCNRTAQVFEVGSGRRVCTLADDAANSAATDKTAAGGGGGDLYIRSVRFSPDGRWLATGAEDERVRIWDIPTQTLLAVFEGHRQDVYSLDFSPDGRRLVSGSGDGSVRVWDLGALFASSGGSRHEGPHRADSYSGRDGREAHPQPRRADSHHRSDSRDGRDAGPQRADSRDGRHPLAHRSDSHPAPAHHRSDSLDARRPDSRGPHRVDSLDARAPRSRPSSQHDPLLLTLTAHPDAGAPDDDAGVMAVALSPDGALVAAGCVDAVVRVWDARSGVLVEVLRGHGSSVHSVAWVREGGGLVSGALDNTIRVWDLQKREREGQGKSGKRERECTVFAGHKDYVLSVGISRDAQWIVSGSKDRGVHFWDGAGVVQCMLQGHKNSVISTSLHPMGNLLATGSGDKLARIWSYNAI
ncbi:WD40-repeat-containing domain protein, partial [Mycena latifolia]